MLFSQHCRSRAAYLLSFLLSGLFSSLCNADMDVNLTANIINNTCYISVDNNGNINMPIVSTGYFNARGNPPSPLMPTDTAGGTPFNIKVDDCEDWSKGNANRLHFKFRPQSGTFPPESRQVFINEASGGANNVGVVIFSDTTNKNVLNPDGSSDVIYNVEDKTSSQYLTNYTFYARYQNTGPASAGRVTSNVLVSVVYD
ncbi:MAG TPA: fimbrial-like protein [Buttiauxella sp.]|uniref:fimbrial-like protein n=1 Tax=Buttiauxella sp. TaxID=1972222 RepID=UPI002B4AA1BE|nr:fimbrial-like protein [Buttiauxella sp.]HKM96465.1 fimbrial-like protein [Buttiauxella sp.]